MAYNFMSLFRHALINSNKKKFLKTIRYELISYNPQNEAFRLSITNRIIS